MKDIAKHNAAGIYMYKSARKNSRWIHIPVYHLISKENEYISDERIIDQFIGVIEKMAAYARKHNHIDFDASINFDKNTQYINANNSIYRDTERIYISIPRVECSSIETCINRLYSVFALIYPYNTLNLRELHNNPSIRYIINKFSFPGLE